jgi:hypothetical protein
MCWDGVVDRVTGYGLDNGSGVHPASYKMGTGVISQKSKRVKIPSP